MVWNFESLFIYNFSFLSFEYVEQEFMRSARLPRKEKARAVAGCMVQWCASKDKETVGCCFLNFFLFFLIRHPHPAPYWPGNINKLLHMRHNRTLMSARGKRLRTTSKDIRRPVCLQLSQVLTFACDFQTASYCHMKRHQHHKSCRPQEVCSRMALSMR